MKFAKVMFYRCMYVHTGGIHGGGQAWQGCARWGHMWQGVCMVGACKAGGMQGKGYAWPGRLVWLRGASIAGDMCDKGACMGVCMAGGMSGRGLPWQGVCIVWGGLGMLGQGTCVVGGMGVHLTGMHSCFLNYNMHLAITSLKVDINVHSKLKFHIARHFNMVGYYMLLRSFIISSSI